MSADIPNIPPYRPLAPASKEFIALRTIVMSMVCIMAGEFERMSGQPAQFFINNLTIASIGKADIIASDGRNMEGIRSEAIEHINKILGGIRFPGQSDNTN